MKVKIFGLARPRNYREHLVLLLFGLAGLVDNLVVVGSLGFLSCDIRPWIMFSGWVDKYTNIKGHDQADMDSVEFCWGEPDITENSDGNT